MRALPSLLLAGAFGLGGLLLAPAPAEAHGGWRGRDYYSGGYYVSPPPRVYGGPRYYAPPRAYYRPPPPVYYRPPPPAYYAPPPAFYGGVPYGGVPYGVPRSYGIPPGPGVGLFIR
jgi:hypothetical protein